MHPTDSQTLSSFNNKSPVMNGITSLLVVLVWLVEDWENLFAPSKLRSRTCVTGVSTQESSDWKLDVCSGIRIGFLAACFRLDRAECLPPTTWFVSKTDNRCPHHGSPHLQSVEVSRKLLSYLEIRGG